jgi:hypothetical protein
MVIDIKNKFAILKDRIFDSFQLLLDKSLTIKFMKKYIAIIYTLFCLSSCNNKYEIVDITLNADSCFYVKNLNSKQIDSAVRKVYIIENKLIDTVLFGFTILHPKYHGSLIYLQVDTLKTQSLYPSQNANSLPKTAIFCINRYKNKNVSGSLKVKYYY